MSKNQIFSSPLGIGLGIGIGTALGSMVIGAIGFTIFKYSKGLGKGDSDEGGEGVDEELRSSSMFDFDPDLGRGSSLSKNPLEDLKQDNAFNKDTNYNHTKVLGGKHSKKRKGKSKKKGKNKFRTLKKV